MCPRVLDRHPARDFPESQEHGCNGGRSHRINRNTQNQKEMLALKAPRSVRSTRLRLTTTHRSCSHQPSDSTSQHPTGAQAAPTPLCVCSRHQQEEPLPGYCECFANLRYCLNCNCVDCNNTKDHEQIRKEAIKTTKERNSTALPLRLAATRRSTACHCKNSCA